MPPLRSFARSLPLFLSLVACRASTPPHPVLSGCHPACPGAATARVGDAGASLRGAPARSAPELAPVELPAASSAAFLCPMHPEIGSEEPARCPDCNMKLVPRAEVLEHDHGN